MSRKFSSQSVLSALALVVAVALVAWLFWPQDNELDRLRSDDPKTITPAVPKNVRTKTEPAAPKSKKPESRTGTVKVAPETVAEERQPPAPAAPPAESASTRPADRSSEDFRVSDPENYATLNSGTFLVSDKVEDLVPGEATTEFSPGQRVYAFAAIRAPRPETVRITWFDETGKALVPTAYLDVQTNTGETGYRVFTYRSFRDPGDYAVRIYNSTGAEIGSARFRVK